MLLLTSSEHLAKASGRPASTRNHRNTFTTTTTTTTTLRPKTQWLTGVRVNQIGPILCIVLIAVSLQQQASGNPLAAYHDQCQNSLARAGDSLAVQMLVFLKCDIKSAYELFVAAHHDSQAPREIDNDLEAGQEFAKLGQTIDEFTREALEMLELRQFCVYSTFKRFKNLRELASRSGDSKLLWYAYDLIAIELHTYCLSQTMSKLPAVPYLVADVVKIYIEGADAPLPDLNGPPASEMDVDTGDDDTPFDVDAAIRANGSLEQVASLSLSMGMGFGSASDSAQTAREFRDTCRKFVTTIQEHWDPMEMMNTLVSTDGNAIKHVNNYVARTLAPIKYADICTKISARA